MNLTFKSYTMKKLLFLLMALPLFCYSQNVVIPDSNFKAYLVRDSEINTNRDKEIQVSEASAYGGRMDLGSRDIMSLKGIEAFTALTSLSCDSNQLTSLDISKNTALTWLSCGNNKLTSLDVSKNTALIWLHCNDNQLNTLDVSKNTELDELFCSNNQLTTLDVSKNAALTWLYCSNNQLNTLDVSKNTALTSLECVGNLFDCDALLKRN